MIFPHPVSSGSLAGRLTAVGFAGWTDAIKADFSGNASNDVVGSVLLSETQRLRVWAIHLAAGARLGAHLHSKDYFWIALTDGESVQHSEDGTTRYVRYREGETRHFDLAPGQHILHDLHNVGARPLHFITVEHKLSAS